MRLNTPNRKPWKNMEWKLTELKREIDKSTMIVRIFNISVTVMDRTNIQNNINIKDVKNIITILI